MLKLKQIWLAISLASFSIFTAAYAAVPTGVDTSIAEAGTDVNTVYGYLIGAVMTFIAAAWILSAVKRR